MSNRLSEHVFINDACDEITIYGIRYAGELFRDFAEDLPLGATFEITKRSDGVLTLRRKYGTVDLL